MTPANATIATNSFLSWVRQGLATSVAAPGSAATLPRRAAIGVGMRVNDTALVVNLQLHGPGDVVGIDPRLVVRTTPHHGSTDFEPNYFPAIEFAHSALPWLFTPVAPADQKLLPWICLAVIRRQDGVTFEQPDPTRPLPVLVFNGAAHPLDELPPLDEAWAWAHAHVCWARNPQPDLGTITERLAEVLRKSPHQTLSRLVCPRRMVAGAQYYACVVPVFDLGVKAGLGLATAEDDAPGTLQLAWRSDAPPPLPFRLPVYYKWEFTAGAAGDFESLVRRIVGRTNLPGVGQRPMDVSHAGPSTLDMPEVTLALEGALQPAGMTPTSWDRSKRARFERALTSMLDAPAKTTMSAAPAGELVVAPPLYGQSQTGQIVVPPANQPNHPYAWLRALNLDPRNRAAAAFGATIVQREQEQLMASAWAQLAELRRVNAIFQKAQLAREINGVTHRKRLSALSPGGVVAVARPALTRVGTSDPSLAGVNTLRTDVGDASVATFLAWITDSAITAGAVSSAFQAISRPGGPVAKRLFASSEAVQSVVMERLNTKGATRIVAAPPRPVPDGTVSVEEVSKRLDETQGGQTYAQVRLRAATPAKLTDDDPQNPLVGWAQHWKYHNSPSQQLDFRAARGEVGLMRRRNPDDPNWEPSAPDLPDWESQERAALAKAFAEAAWKHQTYLLRGHDLGDSSAGKVSRDLGALKAQLLVSLDPKETSTRRVGGQLPDAPPQLWDRPDPLDPVLAAPRYRQPMAEPLRQLSPQLILAGADHVPADTMAFLTPNHRFIEAYLVGLNQEMSRELLWRGYPGDLGATYFRHFWNTSGSLGNPEPTPECPQGEDFRAIRDWRDTSLGGNMCGASAQAPLVLLLRSDVLRRYPSTTIYAAKAVGGGELLLGDQEEYPLFRITLEPDITVFGFALTESQVRGNGIGDDLGYYFVLQQHPSAPVFGLAAAKSTRPLSHWSALSWEDLPELAPGAQPTHVRVTAHVPPPVDAGGLTWGLNAAHMASITMRTPVRVARHAGSLLPASV